MSYRHQVTLSDQAEELLARLIETGLYGRTIPEAIRRIVDRQLQSLIKLPGKQFRNLRTGYAEEPEP